MSDLNLRAADARDLDVLVEFNAAMAIETEALNLDRERLRAGVAALLADPAKGRYRVAERAGAVVGALMLTREYLKVAKSAFPCEGCRTVCHRGSFPVCNIEGCLPPDCDSSAISERQ